MALHLSAMVGSLTPASTLDDACADSTSTEMARGIENVQSGRQRRIMFDGPRPDQ